MRIFAADIGGTKIKYCISNEEGIFEAYHEIDTESQKGGPYIIRKLEDVISAHPSIDAISISTAGQVDSEKGSIIFANDNIPNYTGTNIKDLLEDRFQVPVKVENDVNAAALGEKFFGDVRQYSNFLFLTFGTGIGGAIIIDSKLYKGAQGIAGEFGHMMTHPNGLPCNCGKYGCYECYASTTALVNAALKIDSECVNGRIIFEKIHMKDKKILSIFDAWTYEAAIGIANLIHLFNPNAVVIGGGIMEQNLSVKMVSEKVKALILKSFSEVRLLKSRLGNKAGLYGGIALQL
ncbi:ROK family protein [Camelliibacillus cellulosilyticus]|uniref:ROK family protein n=1 Tax=Camelliibacillus cellulosilyticus TaxID=2174486 RepID=A0ABV9GQM7_9BACL